MREIIRSLAMLGLFTAITGLFYPLAVTGLATLFFPGEAGGSLIRDGERITGSELIGRAFRGPRYFHGRPSSSDYDGMNSGGTNLGPANRKLFEAVRTRAAALRRENGLPENARVPADLVLASASGLDPHISLEGALLQAPRVARERKIEVNRVTGLIMRNARKRYFNLFGDEIVSVTALNRALDSAGGR